MFEESLDESERKTLLDAVEEDRLTAHVLTSQVGSAKNLARHVQLVRSGFTGHSLDKYTKIKI